MNWKTTSPNQIGATVHVLTDLSIDPYLAVDSDTNVLGNFTATNADIKSPFIRKTFYLPTIFVRLFLERDLTPAEAQTHLHGAIVDKGQEFHFWPHIDWLCVVLTKKVDNNEFPLAIP